MTPFWSTLDYTEAIIVKGLLEQAGFLVHMDNFNTEGVASFFAAGHSFRLWVPDSDVEAATDHLKTVRAEAAANLAAEEAEEGLD